MAAGEHGRIETRKICTKLQLNVYLHFPHVGRVFAMQREFIDKKTGKVSSKGLVYVISSRKKEQADAQKILKVDRGHWSIKNSCHYILDCNYDKVRCRIRTGNGSENISRLRRFVISVIKSNKVLSVAHKMRELSFNARAVFDYLKIIKNFKWPRLTEQ